MKKFVSRHLYSFHFAVNGLFTTLRTQSNIWVQIPIAILAILAGFYFAITPTEWLILILTIAAVLSAELLNTAFEITLNYLTKEYHLDVKAAKDIAAGAVLIASLASVVVGLIIFLPYLVR
ncbi:MAG: diacylglycerol kinase family protein [Candidatus Cloacimonetes bacterium]|nr:diacylglycerol kinase family protein [Candidatus Cloacimonadota bacterium]